MTRTQRALTAVLLATAGCLALATNGAAYWSSGGNGSTTALVENMLGGIQPSASNSTTTVTVTVPQISVAGQFIGALGGGYTVRRFPATAGAGVVPPSGSCSTAVSGSGATLSCTETNTPRGDWKYTVSPALLSWTSAESAPSAIVVVAPGAPAGLTPTRLPAASIKLDWTAGAGATGYNVYRRTSSGSYNFSSPVNGATPVIGTTYTDSTAISGTAYAYVVRSRVVGSAGQQIESGNSSESALVTADGNLPTGVTLASVTTPIRASVAVSGAASDTLSGVASWELEYKPAAGSAWSTGCTDSASPYGCSWDTTAVPDGLYDVRARAVDVAGNQAVSATQLNRRIDNTQPTTALSDPGIYLRGTLNLNATASDAGSGLSALAIQRKLSSGGTWTTICSGATSPRNCTFNTTTVADGLYDFRALGTDVAGNEGYMVFPNRTIDNTPPVVSDIQTTNGGTLGRPDSGDTIIYTYSEEIDPSTIMSGWSGSTTDVAVRLNYSFGASDTLTVFDNSNSSQVAIGSVNIGDGYVSFLTWLFNGNPVFNATMVQSGNAVTITLGSLRSSSTTTSAGNRTLYWTGNTANTDLAGNALTAGTATESGPADPNF